MRASLNVFKHKETKCLLLVPVPSLSGSPRPLPHIRTAHAVTDPLSRCVSECWEHDQGKVVSGSECNDHNRKTRNDQCNGLTCAGSSYSCGWCQRHDGDGCTLLSQIGAAKECDTDEHGTAKCAALEENLMGCPKLSHRKPNADPTDTLNGLTVMGQCCYQCAKQVPPVPPVSWVLLAENLPKNGVFLGLSRTYTVALSMSERCIRMPNWQ